MGLPLLVGESDDSEEFEVDLWEELALLFPARTVKASAASPPLAVAPLAAGCGTKITDIQLSSESRDVSLCMLESLLLESELASLRDSLRSRLEEASLSGHSKQQRRIGDRRPGFSIKGDASCC